MSPTERAEFERMKRELDILSRVIEVRGNRIYLKKTVVVDGIINADKVYTQRSGSYVELIT